MCAKGIVIRDGEPGQFAAAPLSAVSLPLRCPRPVASSRWHSATAPHCQEHLRISAPASNKPHLAEKSTPVWLAIWRTWAGFANSQLLPDAAAAAPSRALSAESPRSGNFSAQTSASLHPSRSASLAGPPIHEEMVVHGLCGRVPDSAGKVYLPDCICPLDCCCSDRRKSVGPSAPIAYATSVSPPDEAAARQGCRC